jgi:hypothetical protein
MSSVPSQSNVVGTVPWLPWPLSTSSWWTRPVRAEYLAVVRIGIALTLLCDQLLRYLPCLDALYGEGSTGSAKPWSAETPVWRWSLFLGLDQPPINSLALAAWLALTVWIGLRLATLPRQEDGPHGGQDFRGWLVGWLLAGLAYVLGVWIRATAAQQPPLILGLLPTILLGTAVAFLAIHLVRFGRAVTWFLACCSAGVVLVLLGVVLGREEEARRLYQDLFVGWGDNFALLQAAFLAWALFTVCLALGLFTRLSAVLVWVLTLSFTTLNELPNHGGDSARNIVLFYLMLCPCGAAWSVDRLLSRWRGAGGAPVYVPPWPLRLLLLQLALIYCSAGLVKLLGESWRGGDALSYSLADLIFSRMSLAQVALPNWFMRPMTWLVMFWEVTFPLWLLLRWTRTAALMAGVLFHLGTLVLLELGGFELYMLVFYLPLLPWSRWLGEEGLVAPGAPAAQEDRPALAAWRPGWRPRLLGLFVLWQLLFLAVGHLLSYALYAADKLPAAGTAVAEEVAPGWTSGQGNFWDLLQRVSSVTDFWGDVTAQRCFWEMYTPPSVVAYLPSLAISYPVEPEPGDWEAAALGSAVWAWAGPRETVADCCLALWLAHSPLPPPAAYETVVWPSDNEPSDTRSYFRLVRPRFGKVDQIILDGAPDEGDESNQEGNEDRARAIAEVVGSQALRVRNYLVCRLRQVRALFPGLPEPEEVILSLRRYWINPPGSPDLWYEPRDMLVVRWFPREKDLQRSLEVYNPASGQFEPLAAPEEPEDN